MYILLDTVSVTYYMAEPCSRHGKRPKTKSQLPWL